MSYSLHAAFLAAICLAFSTGCQVENNNDPMVETQRPVIDDDVDHTTVPVEDNDTEINDTEINETEVNDPAVTPVAPAQDDADTSSDIDIDLDDSIQPVPVEAPENDAAPAGDASAPADDASVEEVEADQPE